jgi:hypothetical protein
MSIVSCPWCNELITIPDYSIPCSMYRHSHDGKTHLFKISIIDCVVVVEKLHSMESGYLPKDKNTHLME